MLTSASIGTPVYANATVQVFVIHLQAHQRLSIEIPAQQLQGMAITETLKLSYASQSYTLTPGIEVSVNLDSSEAEQTSQSITLENPSAVEADCLVLAFGDYKHSLSDNSPPPTEIRPWGSFTVLADIPSYKLKVIDVSPDSRLSLQRHQKREEHWFVIDGQPEVTIHESVIHARAGQCLHIPRQAWHRLTNPTSAPVSIIELQRGDYFGEDDIERQQDDYGRS